MSNAYSRLLYIILLLKNI